MQVGTYPTRNFARILSLCFQRSRTFSCAACVHRRSNGSDGFDACGLQVFSLLHEVQDSSKPREVDVFLRFKRMRFEEWYDSIDEVIQPPNSIRHSISVIAPHHTAPEKLLQGMQELHIPAMLNNDEFGEHLKLTRHPGVRVDADVEATFAVNEPHDPVSIELLRTRLNVKSLRVLHCWSLPCGLSPCPPAFDCHAQRDEYRAAVLRSFPHMVQFY